MPTDTISIFTDGSAVYDKDAKCWVEAGFGLAAVCGGEGAEHEDGRHIHEQCGPISIGPHGAQQLTNNVAELVALLHALHWACEAPEARDKPICLRYDSKYAALTSSGVWRAKSNKALVETVRAAWKRARMLKRGTLWMRHVKGHSDHQWNDVADALADQGRRGRVRSGPPGVRVVD